MWTEIATESNWAEGNSGGSEKAMTRFKTHTDLSSMDALKSFDIGVTLFRVQRLFDVGSGEFGSTMASDGVEYLNPRIGGQYLQTSTMYEAATDGATRGTKPSNSYTIVAYNGLADYQMYGCIISDYRLTIPNEGFINQNIEFIHYDTKIYKHLVTIACHADDAASNDLDGTYFSFYDNGGTEYYCWFDEDDGSADPSASGTGIEVDYSAGDSASTIASAIETAIDASAADIDVEVSSDTVYLRYDHNTSPSNASDGDTGFTISNGYDSITGTENGYSTATRATHDDVTTLTVDGNDIDYLNAELHITNEWKFYTDIGDYYRSVPRLNSKTVEWSFRFRSYERARELEADLENTTQPQTLDVVLAITLDGTNISNTFSNMRVKSLDTTSIPEFDFKVYELTLEATPTYSLS
jgi:hypothetical protein